MSIQLDPKTAEKIRNFGRRRRKLILLRGVCTFITLVLLAFGVVGMIDYLVFMEDWMRYVLSGIAYSALLVALYKTCIKQLTHRSTVQELAIMFEMADPSMREKLLSAVELGDSSNKSSYDSAVFRELIQRDVAEKVDKVKIESILPQALVKKWLRAALITGGIFAAMLLIPQLKFATLMLRAVAPVANVERVSNIEVTIVKPEKPDSIVPEGDKVSVIIEVSDPEVNTAYLETYPDEGEASKISMQKISDNRFTSTISVGRKDLRYRLRAHTALTRYYDLKVMARPHIIDFEKSFNYPAYTKLDSTTEKSKSGDIKVLEGSEVDLILTTDQKIKKAELRFENTAGKYWKRPLEIVNDNTLKGKITVDGNSTYKVHLVSAVSGFENQFSPQYEIQAVADVLPSITMSQPQSDLAVPRDELLQFQGVAKDDLGLKDIQISFRKNAAKWKEKVIIESEKKDLSIVYQWDLSKEKFQPGDEITVRLAARDLKNNKGYSSSIRLLIVPDGFSPNRINKLVEFREISKSLQTLAKSAKELSESMKKGLNGDALRRKQQLVQSSRYFENTATVADETLDAVKESISRLKHKRSVNDLALVGKVISHIQHSMLEAPLNALADADQATEKEAYAEAGKLAAKSQYVSQRLSDLFKRLVANNSGDIISADLNQLAFEQKNLDSPLFQQNMAIEQIARREKSLLKNATFTAEMVKEIKSYADNGSSFQHIENRINQVVKYGEDVLARGPKETQGKFQGEYFSDDNLRTRKFERQDSQLYRDWGGSPGGGIPNDYWSARWTTKIRAPKDGKYKFTIQHDGGLRFWLDDKLVVDDWNHSKVRDSKVTVDLKADRDARVRIEYRDDTSGAIVRFDWEGPGMGRRRVTPANFLRYSFNSVENQLKSFAREFLHKKRDISVKAKQARAEIRKLLEEENKKLEKVEKAAKELAKKAEELQKAEKPEEHKQEKKEDVASAEKKAERAEEELKEKKEELAQAEKENKPAEQKKQAQEEVAKAEKEKKEADEKVKQEKEELAQAEKAEKKSDEEVQKKKEEVAKAEKKLEDAVAEAKEQLKDTAEIEEKKKKADSKFVEDADKTAKALEEIQKEAQKNPEKAAEKAEKIADAFKELKKEHELKEAEKRLEEIAKAEKAPEDDPKRTEQSPDDFKEAKEALERVADELKKENEADSKETAENLEKALNDKDTKDVAREMKQREEKGEAKKDVSEDVKELKEAVAEARKDAKEKVEEARKALNEESPSLGEQLEQLADEARDNQEETAKLDEELDNKSNEEVQQQSKEMQIKQEDLNDKLEEMRKALRREANAQDLNEEEGLEKARDADDALAKLQQPPPKAEEELRKAATSTDKEEQKEALQQADQQQEKIADALEQLSEHFNKREEGTPEEQELSRQELRKDEKEMGVQEKLDEQYEKPEAIAEAQGKSVEEQIDELEKILAKDETMQKELSDIAEENAKDAAEQLAEAAKQEEKIDQQLDQKQNSNESQQAQEMKQQAKKQQQAQEQAQEAADALERAAEHQERLGENQKTDAAQKLAEQAQKAAEAAQEAAEELAQKDNFSEAQKAVEEAKKATQEAAESAQQAKQQAEQEAAQQAQQQGEQQQGDATPQEEASKQLAQALDQLDQAQQAQEAAQEAMQKAQEASKQAAQQAQQAAQQAQQTQGEQQQQKAQQAAQQAQQAAESAQQAAQQAQQAAESAQQAHQESQQSPEATESAQQAAAQALKEAMKQQAQAEQAMQQAQTQAEQAAAQAQQAAAQAQQAQAQAQQAQAQAQQAMQQAQQSMQQAQQAQAESMAESRQPSSQGTEPAKAAESIAANHKFKMTEEKLKQEEEWAKLPKKLARDLKDAKRETVPEQYKGMVNAYFKIIAEQAKEKEKK